MNQQDYEELKMWRENNKKKIQQKNLNKPVIMTIYINNTSAIISSIDEINKRRIKKKKKIKRWKKKICKMKEMSKFSAKQYSIS